MKKSILIFSLLFCHVLVAYSQITFERTYGDEEYANRGFSVHQTFDGGYILAGERQNDSVSSDVYLIKTDVNGDTLWTKCFSGDMSLNSGYSIDQTIDSGYVIVGVSGDYYNDSSELLFIKTNKNGNVIWNKTLGGSGGDIGYCVQQTHDTGFVISGSTKSFSEKSMIYLIKTDQYGDTTWTRTYGGDYNFYGGSCVKQTNDSGYIVAGTKGTPWYPVGFIMKTDSYGDSLWTSYKMYSLNSVDQTLDGGYAASGSALVYGGPGAIAISKFDPEGEVEWVKTIGGIGGVSFGRSIRQTMDGGLIIGGNWYSEACLIKTNFLGDSTWMYFHGSDGWDVFYSISQTDDGGYIAAGTLGQNFIYLLKTDENGTITWVNEIDFNQRNTLKIFPNPANKIATMEYSFERREEIILSIRNLKGQEIRIDLLGKKTNGKDVLNCTDLSPGVYFVTLKTNSATLTKKLIIE